MSGEGIEPKGKTMAHDAPQATGPSKLVIRNVGLLLSGALEKPILDGDTIVAENGKITAIGRFKDVNTEGATTIVDANGTTAAPGLIDSHVQPSAVGWPPAGPPATSTPSPATGRLGRTRSTGSTATSMAVSPP